MKPFKKSFTKNEGELKKRLNYHADNNDYFMVDIEKIEEILDEAKKEFVTQSISLKDAVTVLKDVDQTKIICFPVDLFLKWFGTPEKETT